MFSASRHEDVLIISPGSVAKKPSASVNTTATRIAHNSRLLTQYVKSWEEDTAKFSKDLAKYTPPEWLSQTEHRLYF